MNLFIASLVMLVLMWILVSGRASVYRYRMDQDALIVRFFNLFDLYSVPYMDMSDVRVARSWDYSSSGWMPLLLKNRFAIDVVVVCRVNGFFRKIVLTPEHPHDFVAALHAARNALISAQSTRSV